MIHTIIETNPRLIATCCPGHSKSGDIYVIHGHLKEIVIEICRGHSHHIRAFAFQRERLVHIHVLGVIPAMHIDRVPRIRSTNRRLYRRPALIERTTIAPPAAFVDIELLGSRHAREREPQCKYNDMPFQFTHISFLLLICGYYHESIASLLSYCVFIADITDYVLSA